MRETTASAHFVMHTMLPDIIYDRLDSGSVMLIGGISMEGCTDHVTLITVRCGRKPLAPLSDLTVVQ